MSYLKNTKLHDELGFTTIPTTLFYKNGKEAYARFAGGCDDSGYIEGGLLYMIEKAPK